MRRYARASDRREAVAARESHGCVNQTHDEPTLLDIAGWYAEDLDNRKQLGRPYLLVCVRARACVLIMVNHVFFHYSYEYVCILDIVFVDLWR